MEQENMYREMDPADLIVLKREEMNVSLEQVSEAIGVTKEYLKKIEVKKAPITPDMSEKLSAFYQVQIPTIKRVKEPQPKKHKKIDQTIKKKSEEPDLDEAQYKVLNRELKRQNKILAMEVIRLSNIIEKILNVAETVDEYTPGLMPNGEEQY